MNHSNLSNIKSLRKANYFLFALTGLAVILLAAALVITYYCLLPDFYSSFWYLSIVNSMFFFSTVCGVIFIYMGVFCYHQNNGWAFLISGYILASLLFLATEAHLLHITFYLANPCILIIWLCCLVSLIKAIINSSDIKRTININLLLTIILPVLFVILTIFFLALTIFFHPHTEDPLLMSIDATLGIYPSFLAGQLFSHLPSLVFSIIKWVYLGLPCSMSIVYIGRFYQEKEPPLEFIIEFFLIGMIGMLLYHINAGCGPINAFKTIWPQHLPIVPLHPQEQICSGIFLPRNCLPSLHTAWAVCLWRHSLRCNKLIKILICIFVILTLLATLGLGEHYFIDLIVGFAFATCIGGICAISLPLKQAAREYAILGGGLLCIIWYLLINFGLNFLRISPLLAWFCYLASIYLTGRIEFNLTRDQRLMTTHGNMPQDMQ